MLGVRLWIIPAATLHLVSIDPGMGWCVTDGIVQRRGVMTWSCANTTIGELVELLSRTAVRLLTGTHEPPCISLYQPTHRHHPHNQQDPIRFRNLLRTVEESLRQRYTGTHDLVAPLQALVSDAAFWNHTRDGLAVLANPRFFRVFQVQRPVKELAVVADSFHVKPLLRLVQSGDRYHVLCVTRRSARVFEGNRDALDELDPGTVPANIEAALGDQRSEPHQTVAARAGLGRCFTGLGRGRTRWTTTWSGTSAPWTGQ